VFGEIDWPCDVLTLFRDTNLGCRLSVSGGIDWFFEHEDSGIILEDDTVPHQSFFAFCEENLRRYANQESVAMISGNNFTSVGSCVDDSYFFSAYGGVWGWATWKRAWGNYDRAMTWAQDGRKRKVMARLSVNQKARSYWNWAYLGVTNGIFDTWDFQWTFTVADHKQYVIVPVTNLVENIGFGNDATHTSSGEAPRPVTSGAISLPIRHCNILERKLEFEIQNARLLPERRPLVLALRGLVAGFIRYGLDPLYKRFR